MTLEKKQEFTLKISEANKTQMITIIYEMVMYYLDEAIENIVETVAGVRSTGEEGYDKEETVYVIADAEGNANEIIASEWLKNLEGSDKIEDISSLKDIIGGAH